ncbi:MAG: AbrB/MazE/SpoVT family DNA-binding domain-containing protein [Bacillota bacterium]
MRSIGIVRKIDDLGRMVIPKEMRKKMDIAKKDPMEIFVDGEKIVLQKYSPGCIFCGDVDNTKEFKGETVCEKCRQEIVKA